MKKINIVLQFVVFLLMITSFTNSFAVTWPNLPSSTNGDYINFKDVDGYYWEAIRAYDNQQQDGWVFPIDNVPADQIAIVCRDIGHYLSDRGDVRVLVGMGWIYNVEGDTVSTFNRSFAPA